jgi:hypothetical protein
VHEVVEFSTLPPLELDELLVEAPLLPDELDPVAPPPPELVPVEVIDVPVVPEDDGPVAVLAAPPLPSSLAPLEQPAMSASTNGPPWQSNDCRSRCMPRCPAHVAPTP